jgi:hypothetical protein
MKFLNVALGLLFASLIPFGFLSAEERQKAASSYDEGDPVKVAIVWESGDAEKSYILQNHFNVTGDATAPTDFRLQESPWLFNRLKLRLWVDVARMDALALGIFSWTGKELTPSYNLYMSERIVDLLRKSGLQTLPLSTVRWQELACEVDLSDFSDGFYQFGLFGRPLVGKSLSLSAVFLSAANGPLREFIQTTMPRARDLEAAVNSYDPFLFASVDRLALDARKSLNQVVHPKGKPAFQCSWGKDNIPPLGIRR